MHPSISRLGLARGPGRCTVWAGSGSRFLVLIEIEPAWRPLSLEPGGLLQTRRAGFGFGSGSRPLVFFVRRPNGMPQILNKWTCLWQVGARFGRDLDRSFLCILSQALSLEPGGPVQTTRVQGLGALKRRFSASFWGGNSRRRLKYPEKPPASSRSPCSTAPGSLILFRVRGSGLRRYRV